MQFMALIVGFSLLAHVKCQLDINVEDIIYGEDDEEYDEEAVTTRRSTTVKTSTTTTTKIPTVVVPLSASGNLTNSTTSNQNFTLVVKPSNGTIFGSIITSSVGAGVTTERAQYVLGQVGNIWNNVGKLNISGIVDQALGIRNNYLARPIVTGILNVVFCNPLTFSNNNCQKSSKSGKTNDNSTTDEN